MEPAEVEEDNEDNSKNSKKYFDVEMPLDMYFEGNEEEIQPGKFISFKYWGEYQSGWGPPMHPKVFYIFLYFV